MGARDDETASPGPSVGLESLACVAIGINSVLRHLPKIGVAGANRLLSEGVAS